VRIAKIGPIVKAMECRAKRGTNANEVYLDKTSIAVLLSASRGKTRSASGAAREGAVPFLPALIHQALSV
jgi:hypothetical protein